MSRHSMRQPRQGRNQIRCHQRLRVRGLILDLIPRQYQRGEGTRLSPCPRCPDPQDADRQPDDGAEQGPERPMKPRAWGQAYRDSACRRVAPAGQRRASERTSGRDFPERRRRAKASRPASTSRSMRAQEAGAQPFRNFDEQRVLGGSPRRTTMPKEAEHTSSKPEADAKGQFAKKNKGGMNDGVASADPKPL